MGNTSGLEQHAYPDDTSSQSSVQHYPGQSMSTPSSIPSTSNPSLEPDESLRIGLREGLGKFIAKNRANPRNYEYQGQWKDNQRHGNGRCYFYNGDLYEGEWVKGKRQGKGTAFLQTGERYVGMWEGDRRHG